MAKALSLSIIVPCYNEEKNIPFIFKKFSEVLSLLRKKISVEIILVDNGSTDGSALAFGREIERYRDFSFKVVKVEKNQGYGFGILSGLHQASGDLLAWTHADLQTDPYDVFRAYEVFVSSSMSSREGNYPFVKGHRVRRRFGEWFFTLGMSIISSSVLRKILFDINAQPKLFHRSFFQDLQDPPHDFSLDLFVVYMAKIKKVPIKQIDVSFGKRLYGESKWAFSFKSKYKTVMRTIDYIFELKNRIKVIT